MYRSINVLNFLFEKRVKPSFIRAVRKRLSDISDPNGFFFKEHIGFVIGDEELASQYEQAWNEAQQVRL